MSSKEGLSPRSKLQIAALMTVSLLGVQLANVFVKNMSVNESLFTVLAVQNTVSSMAFSVWEWAFHRRSWRRLPRPVARQAVVAGMWSAVRVWSTVYLYMHVLLGALTALQYVFGPMAVITWAIVKHGRPRDLIWPVLALAGVAALSPPQVAGVDLIVLLWVMANGVGFWHNSKTTEEVGNEERGRFMAIVVLTRLVLVDLSLLVVVGIRGWDGHALTSTEVAVSACAGFLGGFVSNLLYKKAWDRGMTKEFCGVMEACQPMIGTLLALALLGETMELLGWSGIILVLAGCTGAIWSGGENKKQNQEPN